LVNRGDAVNANSATVVITANRMTFGGMFNTIPFASNSVEHGPIS